MVPVQEIKKIISDFITSLLHVMPVTPSLDRTEARHVLYTEKSRQRFGNDSRIVPFFR